VPGRSGEVRDVLIDSLGALIGILIISLIRSAIIRQRKTTFEQ
jgi:VanZ family protein